MKTFCAPICTCSNCHCKLSSRYGQNVYNGGPWYCGNCGHDVTIDMYGKGGRGYYVQSITGGQPVYYKYLVDALEIAEMLGASVFYAYNFHSHPERVDNSRLGDYK